MQVVEEILVARRKFAIDDAVVRRRRSTAATLLHGSARRYSNEERRSTLSRSFDPINPDRGGVIALDLDELVSPAHTALVTVEVQEGVVGSASVLPAIAEAAAAPKMIENIARLARAARAAGIPVIHCTAESRPDGLGASKNARLFGAAAKARSRGYSSRAFEVHADVGAEPGDLVMSRLHGLSPMTGTSLDPVLRNLGVRTIVATGVSVNVALLGLAFEGVNHGYQVVIPRDAVAGVDDAYVEAVFENTFAVIATATTSDALIRRWQAIT